MVIKIKSRLGEGDIVADSVISSESILSVSVYEGGEAVIRLTPDGVQFGPKILQWAPVCVFTSVKEILPFISNDDFILVDSLKGGQIYLRCRNITMVTKAMDQIIIGGDFGVVYAEDNIFDRIVSIIERNEEIWDCD